MALVEHTELIPCSKPLPETTTDPWYSNAGHASTTYTRNVSGVYTDMRPLVRQYTGDPAEIPTDDLGSMPADVAGFSAEVNATYSSTGRKGLHIHAIMQTGWTPPDPTLSPSWSGVWVVRAAAGCRLVLRMTRRSPDDGSSLWNGINTTQNATGDWQRITLNYTEPSGGGSYATRKQALLDGRYAVHASADRPAGASWEPDDFEVAFLGVNVTWYAEEEPPVVALRMPPLRVWPRSDGLGASSAMRIYPAAKSVQSGVRRGPASYR